MSQGNGSTSVEALRLLLVDDDAEQRSLVRGLFTDEGFRLIEEAGDGGAAVETATSFQPDLIVLDLVMPGRSGFEVLPELQDAAPHARIVVLSNLPRRPLDTLVRQRGALGFVEKRVAPVALVGEILMVAALADAVAAAFDVQLEASPLAARDARQHIRGALDAVGSELLESVELLVSELVTNAVVHASSAPRLAVRRSRHGVRVEVHDDDPLLPSPLPPDETRLGGRGLYIVDQLADRWGTEPEGGGKVVWFELDR